MLCSRSVIHVVLRLYLTMISDKSDGDLNCELFINCCTFKFVDLHSCELQNVGMKSV
jgi:hypothetical protein